MILWMQILNRKKLKEAKSFMVLALVSFGQSEEPEYKKDPETKSFGILHGLKYISYSHSMVAFGLGDRS